MQAWQQYTSSLLMPKRSLPKTKATRCAVALKLSNSARGACVGGPKSRGVIAVAQAVQLLAYDWRQALGGFNVAARTADATLADGLAVQGMLDHWQDALQRIGFLDPQAPRKLMPRLNQLFNRSALTLEEVQILRGVARAMIGAANAGERPAPKGQGHGTDVA